MLMQFRLLVKSQFIEELGIDFLTASAHKFHGPKRIGFISTHLMDFDSYLNMAEIRNRKNVRTEKICLPS